MDKTKQRIAIAEFYGLKNIRMEWDWMYGDRLVHGNGTCVPNYLGDLNAVHEVEMSLDDIQIDMYKNYLCVIYTSPARIPHSATAEQRVEAILKTIGKWED